jgi:pantoate--beta-alanine ligase
MKIIKGIDSLKEYLKEARLTAKSIGLVPTMGALHSGHISLIKACKLENQVTVCSIYVNPAQFNNNDDLLKYPRTLEGDIALLENVGCDVLFCPTNEEMYAEKPTVSFDFGALSEVMEGRYRPGHFSGVALVVSKFFNIVQPNHAYFGQKDWQQFAILQKLVEELKFDLTLHQIGTLREKDGLAMSSRNLRLSEDQRIAAVVFYQSLLTAKELLLAGQKIEEVKKQVRDNVERQGATLEYFEVADSKNLNLLKSVKDQENKPIMCIAGFIGEVRLIDNMFID